MKNDFWNKSSPLHAVVIPESRILHLYHTFRYDLFIFQFQLNELLSGLSTGYELDGRDKDGLDSGKEADDMYE